MTMTERPTTVEEWEAAVREIADGYAAYKDDRFRGAAVCVELRRLLPPAKERVPWWEAKGRTVDGRPITSGAVVTNSPFDEDPPRVFMADSDGMVEVDAR